MADGPEASRYRFTSGFTGGHAENSGAGDQGRFDDD
jgi:hypothetical protein